MDQKPQLGIIGGSGFYSLDPVKTGIEESHVTPFLEAPVKLYREQLSGREVIFLPRHGKDHSVPPHRINYRANLYALKEAGVRRIIAVNAVGGIHASAGPGQLVIPDQIIDYTWGRKHTYFDGPDALENHIDFTNPYHADLGELLRRACDTLSIPVLYGAVYGCTQGPRLETAAEVRKLRNDGCDILGMTGMPEAALARELELDYASIALVVNWAAGLTEREITLAQIQAELDRGVSLIRQVLGRLISDCL